MEFMIGIDQVANNIISQKAQPQPSEATGTPPNTSVGTAEIKKPLMPSVGTAAIIS